MTLIRIPTARGMGRLEKPALFEEEHLHNCRRCARGVVTSPPAPEAHLYVFTHFIRPVTTNPSISISSAMLR